MERLTKSQKRAQFFAALGHTRRLRILAILIEYPKGVPFEVIEALSGIKGASLFHHLRPLRDAGLISRKIKGRNPDGRLTPSRKVFQILRDL